MKGLPPVKTLEEVELETYLAQEEVPLHTQFLVNEKGICPVYFGSYEDKQRVAHALCTELHLKVLSKWGTISCHCGIVPRIKLSKTPRNMHKVFLCCERYQNPCKYFQWIHQPLKPTCLPKSATTSAVKKRLNDMVKEMNTKRQKTKQEPVGGFTFP